MDFNNVLKQTKNLISKIIPINISSVIAIDDVTSTLTLYYKEEDGKGKPVCVVEPFRHSVMEDEFASSLSNLIKIHFEKKAFGKTAVILPDNLFFTDTIRLPIIQKKAMNSSLGFAFNTLYANNKDLKYLSYPLFRDKRNAIYNIVGIRKEILDKVTSALTSIGVEVAGITFASNSAVDRAISFNPKMKNADCVLVDVKETFTRFSLVVDGKAVAYYTLPFGYSRFSQTEVYREDALFDHSASELLVLNAKEKAKNKKLTTYDSTPDALAMETFFKSIVGEEENAEKTEDEEGNGVKENASAEEYLSSGEERPEEEETVAVATVSSGKLNTKSVKRLPKYMVRPTPEDENGFIYENFRHVEKWALELVRANQEVFVTGLPKTIYVNMPDKFSSVFESVKKEGDNDIVFLPLTTAETEKEQREMLEVYGGLYITKRNKFNVF